MDPKRFTDQKTGSLVPIKDPADWAFVPDPLPPAWRPSEEVFRLLADAMEALGRLDGAGRHAPNPDLILRPLRHREALKSSSLEGTHATAQELLLFEVAEQKESHPDAVREVHNYAAALDLGLSRLEEIPYCLRLVREIHKRLLEGVRGQERNPGYFRSKQVHIGSDRRFVPPPPSELSACLDKLEASFHTRPNGIHPLVWSFVLHYQFEAIHPFLDGNGRVGRLLLAMMITSECKLNRPWLYMSPWFDRHKDEYIDSLFRVSSRGDWDGWLRFCLRGTVDQAQDALDRLSSLIALNQEYRTRVASSGGAARLGAIVDGLFAHAPLTTVPDLARNLKVTYPTANADLERLAELGVVQLMADRKPKLFVAWDIIRIGIDEDAGVPKEKPEDT